jgi:hypothetical protein
MPAFPERPLSAPSLMLCLLLTPTVCAESMPECRTVDASSGIDTILLRPGTVVRRHPTDTEGLAQVSGDAPQPYAVQELDWVGGRQWAKILCNFPTGGSGYGWVGAEALIPLVQRCITRKPARLAPRSGSAPSNEIIETHVLHWGREAAEPPPDSRTPAAPAPDDPAPSLIDAQASGCFRVSLAATLPIGSSGDAGTRPDDAAPRSAPPPPGRAPHPALFFSDREALVQLLRLDPAQRKDCLARFRARMPLGHCPEPPAGIAQAVFSREPASAPSSPVFPILDAVRSPDSPRLDLFKVKAIAHSAVPPPRDWQPSLALMFVLDTTHSMLCAPKGLSAPDADCDSATAVGTEVANVIRRTRLRRPTSRLQVGLVSFWYERRDAGESTDCRGGPSPERRESQDLAIQAKAQGCYKAEYTLSLVARDYDVKMTETLTKLYDTSAKRSQNSPGREEDLCFALRHAVELARKDTGGSAALDLWLITDAGAQLSRPAERAEPAAQDHQHRHTRVGWPVCLDWLGNRADGSPNARVSVLYLSRTQDAPRDSTALDQYTALADATGGTLVQIVLPQDAPPSVNESATAHEDRLPDICNAPAAACGTSIASLDGRADLTPAEYWITDAALDERSIGKPFELGLVLTRMELDELARRTERLRAYLSEPEAPAGHPPLMLQTPVDPLPELIQKPKFLDLLPGYNGLRGVYEDWTQETAAERRLAVLSRLRSKLATWHGMLREPAPTLPHSERSPRSGPSPHDLFFLRQTELP